MGFCAGGDNLFGGDGRRSFAFANDNADGFRTTERYASPRCFTPHFRSGGRDGPPVLACAWRAGGDAKPVVPSSYEVVGAVLPFVTV